MKTHIEIPVEIDYDIDPPQRQTMTDPRFDAELYITSAVHNGVDIIEFLSPSALTELKEAAIQYESELGADNE